MQCKTGNYYRPWKSVDTKKKKKMLALFESTQEPEKNKNTSSKKKSYAARQYLTESSCPSFSVFMTVSPYGDISEEISRA